MPTVITSKPISGDPIRALALLTSGIYGTHAENDGQCECHFYATTNQLEESVKLSARLAQSLFQTVLFFGHTYPYSEAVDEDNDQWDNEEQNNSVKCFWRIQIPSYSGGKRREVDSVGEPA